MALGQGSLAGVARVAFEAQTGEFNADIRRSEQIYRDATAGMSDDAIRFQLAQERLRRELAKGPGNYRAIASAELNLRRVQSGLRADVDSSTRSFDRSSRSLERLGRGAVAGSGAFRSLRGALVFASSAFLGGAGIVYAIRQTIQASIDFETAFAGVRKTVDATESEFAVLSDGIREISREIPIAVGELAKIGELGGQLGIANDALLGFTRTVADLGVTTDLSVEAAATALARFANITQLPQSEVDRLGATVVELGNNLAATESEIINFGLRIAAAGRIIGLTEAQTLAIAGAFTSVGVEAEAGGTAVSKVFISLANAVKSGGSQLELFARTAGMTVGQFKQLFERDTAAAFVAFTEGLRRIDKEGGNVFRTLSDLGLTDQRLTRAFLSISQSGDVLRRSLDLGSKAWKENTALTEEAGKRYETSASQLQIFRNRVNDLQIVVGDALVPSLLAVVEPLSEWLDQTENQERVQAQVNQLLKDGTVAVKGIAEGLKLAKNVAEPFVDAMGGLGKSIEILTLLWVAFKLKAVASFAATALASALTSRKMVADAAIAGAAWDVATRPRVLPVGTVGVPGAPGAPIPGGGGGRRIPPVLVGNPAIATVGAILVAGGAGTDRGDRSGKYPLVHDAVERASRKRASREEIAILRGELGRYSLANAPDENMARAERGLQRLRDRPARPRSQPGSSADRPTPTRQPARRPAPGSSGDRLPGPLQPAPAPERDRGGADERDRTGRARPRRRTLADIELDIARAERTATRQDDLRFRREQIARFQAQIAALEKRRNLTDEQKATLRGLYGKLEAAEGQVAAIIAEGEQAVAERRAAARAEREEAAERRRTRIRERIATQEERLENRVAAAELSERVRLQERRLRELIAFHRRMQRNDQLELAERREHIRKRIAAQKRLQTLLRQEREDREKAQKTTRQESEREQRGAPRRLTPAQIVGLEGFGGAQGLTQTRARLRSQEEEFMRSVRSMQFEFLTSLQGTMNQFGGNLHAPGSLQVGGGNGPNPELFSMVTLMREQNHMLSDLGSSVRQPGTRYAGTEIAHLFDGPTF